MSTPDAKAILEAARRTCADPAVWVNHAPVPGTSQECAVTALGHACGEVEGLAYNRAFILLDSAIGGVPIADFNDSHSQAEVLAAFDRAIEAA
jgi:hypothetical protein